METVYQKLTRLRQENASLRRKLSNARFTVAVLSCVVALEILALCLVGGAK